MFWTLLDGLKMVATLTARRLVLSSSPQRRHEGQRAPDPRAAHLVRARHEQQPGLELLEHHLRSVPVVGGQGLTVDVQNTFNKN